MIFLNITSNLSSIYFHSAFNFIFTENDNFPLIYKWLFVNMIYGFIQ